MSIDSPKLLLNAVYIPEDNLYLVSTSPDEPVIYTFRDNLVLALQGGTQYALRGGDYVKLLEQNRYVEWIITDEESEEVIADKMLAYSFDDKTYKFIKDMSEIELRTLLMATFLSREEEDLIYYYLDKKVNS